MIRPKVILGCLIILMSVFLCKSQSHKEKINIEETANSLKEYYQKLEEQRAKYERLIFETFPSSFKEMKLLFGHDGEAALLDDDAKKGILSIFKNIKYVEKEPYYNKYIDICIGGKWEGGLIAEGFGLWEKLFYYTKTVVLLLSKRKDEDIVSVFRFLFDAPPRPFGSNEYYERIYIKVKKIDPKMAALMKQAYEQISSKDYGQGR